MLGELRVTSLTHVTPKYGGEEWHQAMFYVMLEKKRVLLKTNKDMWLSRECEMAMTNMQQKIMHQATKLKIDLDALSSDILMSSSMPWEKAWVSFENQVLQLQMEQLKLSSAASLGHKSKVDAHLEKKWTAGEDYKDRNSKSRSKYCLISELELTFFLLSK